MNQWKKNVESQRVNPWFKRAAYILALNSTVDIQKSFWRMKENISATEVTLSAVKIVKLKKMFNNIRKAYELVIAKSFWSVYHGKGIHTSSVSEGKSRPQVQQPQPPARKAEESKPVQVQQIVAVPQANI